MSDEKAISLRDVFGSYLPEIGGREPLLVVLDADLSSSTRTQAFRARFPERYLNVGIAEQNMVGMAAGIALGGGMPFVNTFASFLTRRAADQIAISVAYPKLNVKFFGFHAGINLGEDGATQQSVEDLGIMQAIPGIHVYTPLDAGDLKSAIESVVKTVGPTYVRLSRFPSPDMTPVISEADKGDGFYVLRKGTDLTALVPGSLAPGVVEAANVLSKEGHEIRVIGVSRIKPLARGIADLLRKDRTNRCVVIEEHNTFGGLSDAVSNLLDECGQPHSIDRIGIPNCFGESGPPRLLLEKFGLAGSSLVERLKQTLRGAGL